MAAQKATRKASVSIGTWPTPEQRVVRVTLPRSVAFDLRKFQRVQGSILDRLGCQACCSGFDIRWDFVRDFYVDEQLNIGEISAGVVVTEG